VSATRTDVPPRPRAIDEALVVGRDREDVVVGDEIVRHRLASRSVHWAVALTFFLSLFTGLPIWLPYFHFLSGLVGGLQVCRWVHPWAGVAFAILSVFQFIIWIGDMRSVPGEKSWGASGMIRYLRYENDETDVGKYNSGQKLFFFAVSLGALVLFLTGLVMWFPLTFPVIVREIAILLHDASFIAFAAAIVWHIYLGTAAEPGTFGSMVRGTVTTTWARLHHPGWYREVTGRAPREVPPRARREPPPP
jgi:formate dehydrogenase subunit gamma